MTFSEELGELLDRPPRLVASKVTTAKADFVLPSTPAGTDPTPYADFAMRTKGDASSSLHTISDRELE